LHTPVHGAIENGVSRREGLVTFADRLKQVGYTNIMSGKTHFGPLPDSFDIDLSTSGGKKGGGRYGRHLADHGYEPCNEVPNTIPEDLFFDAFVTTNTIDAMEQVVSEGRAPFFAFCSMVSPHGPLDPPGEWAALYTDDTLPPLPRNPDTDGEPEQAQRLLDLRGKPRSRPEAIRETQRLYYGLASYCDHQVGRLLTYLDEAGLRGNTLVIFTSDHGIDLYDHGFDNKHHWYDATWRVPFIVSQPGTLAQGDTRDFATWNDIPATILGAAGLYEPTFQGFDLYGPLVRGEQSPRRCAVGTLFKSCALATRRWKLEYYLTDGRARLFDRVRDPGEYTDLAGIEAHGAVRHAMVEALLRWRSDLADLAYLHENTGGGGAVAQRVAAWVPELRGTDAEMRLNRSAEGIDRAFM